MQQLSLEIMSLFAVSLNLEKDYFDLNLNIELNDQKIVQVGNQHLQRKNIAIMPATSVISSSSSVTKVSAAVVEPGSRTDLKRRLADAEKEAEKLKVEHESKLEEIKRLKAQLDITDDQL